jgi:predicted dehydrogenase
MMDCGVHDIDLSTWWTRSNVAAWKAAGVWIEDHREPDHIYLHMRHQHGVQSTIEITESYCYNALQPRSTQSYDVIGTEGLIHWNKNNKSVLEIRYLRDYLGDGAAFLY